MLYQLELSEVLDGRDAPGPGSKRMRLLTNDATPMEAIASASRKLSEMGYRWTGTDWTDEPTAEQRLEAIKEMVSGPLFHGARWSSLMGILSPTWRPGKTEGK